MSAILEAWKCPACGAHTTAPECCGRAAPLDTEHFRGVELEFEWFDEVANGPIYQTGPAPWHGIDRTEFERLKQRVVGDLLRAEEEAILAGSAVGFQEPGCKEGDRPLLSPAPSSRTAEEDARLLQAKPSQNSRDAGRVSPREPAGDPEADEGAV